MGDVHHSLLFLFWQRPAPQRQVSLSFNFDEVVFHFQERSQLSVRVNFSQEGPGNFPWCDQPWVDVAAVRKAGLLGPRWALWWRVLWLLYAGKLGVRFWDSLLKRGKKAKEWTAFGERGNRKPGAGLLVFCPASGWVTGGAAWIVPSMWPEEWVEGPPARCSLPKMCWGPKVSLFCSSLS